jgi:hypothetical protein
MEQIKTKIRELLETAHTEIDYKNDHDWSKSKAKYDKMDRIMDELKALAKTIPTLLGRVLSFREGDGYALYVIVKVGKANVTVEWVPYVDNWQTDLFNGNDKMPVAMASKKIGSQDWMDQIFSKTPANQANPEL